MVHSVPLSYLAAYTFQNAAFPSVIQGSYQNDHSSRFSGEKFQKFGQVNGLREKTSISAALQQSKQVYEGLLSSKNEAAQNSISLSFSWFGVGDFGRRDMLFFLLFLLGMKSFDTRCSALASEEPSAQDIPYARPGRRPEISINALESLSSSGAIPEQVRVTLAGPSKMAVTWVTRDKSAPSIVYYGQSESDLPEKSTGSSLNYEYMGWRSGQIHNVILGNSTALKDDAVYYYKCGYDSPVFSFKTPPPIGPETPLNIHVLGDLGQTEWSVSTLSHMSDKEHDFVLFAGDLSYADRFQPRWDSWGRLISPLASSRPWMMVAGNHEIEGMFGMEPPFKAYHARYPMPHREAGSTSNGYYSFEAGSAHFLMLASYEDFSEASAQFKWLQEDLSSVNRAKTPWLVAVLHAPWYNSNHVHQGDGEKMMEAMEHVLHANKVDFLFAGHVHAYERSTRVYKKLPNTEGTIHITIGDGGNREGLATRYLEPCPEWSVKREASFGHGELTILSSSTAKWEWHRNQDDETVVADEVLVSCLHA